jgi:hypothetical protein
MSGFENACHTSDLPQATAPPRGNVNPLAADAGSISGACAAWGLFRCVEPPADSLSCTSGGDFGILRHLSGPYRWLDEACRGRRRRLITIPMGDTGKTVRITARPATIPRDRNVLLATVASSIS